MRVNDEEKKKGNFGREKCGDDFIMGAEDSFDWDLFFFLKQQI